MDAAAPHPACPKRMVFGPCGGVLPSGRCEVAPLPCPFAQGPLAREGAAPAVGARGANGSPPAAERAGAGPPHPDTLASPAAAELLARLDRGGAIVVDLPAPPLDLDALGAAAEALAGHADAALLGDQPWARVQLPAVLRAQAVAAAGLPPWIVLNCRDRNRVALEGELAGLAAIGAPAVHCVTGDHPALGHREDAQPVFDLDATRLVALAAPTGLAVSVAASPQAPPRARRPALLAEKAHAGAQVAFVDRYADLGELTDFAAAVRVLAPSLRLVVCVGVAISSAGVERLAQFVGLDAAAALAGPLAGADPVAAAVRDAATRAAAALGVPGIAGVALGGAAGPGEDRALAAALRNAASRLRA